MAQAELKSKLNDVVMTAEAIRIMEDLQRIYRDDGSGSKLLEGFRKGDTWPVIDDTWLRKWRREFGVSKRYVNVRPKVSPQKIL